MSVSFRPVMEKSVVTSTFDYSVQFSPEVLRKIGHYVDLCDDEISWLGTAEEHPEYFGHYIVENVWLLKQYVSGAWTEITTEGLMDLYETLKDEYGDDHLDMLGKIRFWGHSHVNMDVKPSGQDEKQMKAFTDDGDQPFFIRQIVNKSGKMNLTLFDFDHNLEVTNVPWEYISHGTDDSKIEIEAEIKEKVTKSVVKAFQPPSRRVFTGGTTGGKPNANTDKNPITLADLDDDDWMTDYYTLGAQYTGPDDEVITDLEDITTGWFATDD